MRVHAVSSAGEAGRISGRPVAEAAEPPIPATCKGAWAPALAHYLQNKSGYLHGASNNGISFFAASLLKCLCESALQWATASINHSKTSLD